MNQAQTYQKVLRQLSQLPTSRMKEVQSYLDGLLNTKEEPSRSFAGIWSDMEEEDFQGLMEDMRQNRQKIDKEIDERSID